MTSEPAVATRMSEFASKETLREFLRQSAAPSYVLGQRTESPQEFFCIELQRSSGEKSYVGVYSHGIGVRPGWRHADGRLFVGFNDRVAVLALETLSLEQEIPLLSLFWEFIDVPQTSLICVLCETAIVALGADGLIAWRHDTGLITGSRVEDTVLRLDIDSGSAICVDLRTGVKVA